MEDYAAGTAKTQVMIVDDMEVNQIILAKMIENMGIEPVLASSGAHALELIKESLPRLFLLDITMPEMSGFELCEVLKKDARTREIPIIFISASTDMEDRVKGYGLGGADFIVKPFVLAEVTARIHTHLQMYEMKQKIEIYEQRLNIRSGE